MAYSIDGATDGAIQDVLTLKTIDLNVPVAIVLTAKQPKHVFKYTNDK
jgi:hypothetical protein